MPEQTFANHAKFFPPFHFFAVPVLVIHFGWSLYLWKRSSYSMDEFESVVVAAALLVGLISARLMSLRVQDRVIRLEERLRFQQLLPADLQPRMCEFTTGQLVSLRFASDEELPALARKVLDEKVRERKSIKRLVKNWRADYLRA